MKNNIEIFKNEEFGVIRTVDENGKVLFCGSDVAKALGYSDVAKAIRIHCKKDGWTICPVIDNLGRVQKAKFINEGNLYRLITHSKLPSAEKFESWVFDEVLPSIRKNGEYKIPQNPMEALELMFKVEKENTLKIDKLNSRITNFEENAPLSPGEYIAVGRRVNEKIKSIKSDYSLIDATRQQTSELYKAINRDINDVAGVHTRAQIRRKDFDRVMELIRDWQPSKALIMRINQ